MIEIVKRWILFKLKSFQFQVRTIKNSFEISKAYASNSGSKKIQYRKLITTVVLLIAGIGLLGAIAYGAIVVLHSDFIKNLQTAIVVKNDQTRIDKTSIMNIGMEKDKKGKIVTPVKSDQSDTLTPQQQSSLSVVDTTSTVLNDTIVSAPPVLTVPTVDPSLYVFDSGAHPVSDDSSDYMIIVANKALHTLFLLQKDKKNWKTVRSYFMAIGAQQGQKVTAGDRRTPEGLYIIIERKERYQLSSIYGPLAYVLDYPNASDLAAGRTGTGIWIHGTEIDTVPFETKGCLEMNNADLSELSTLLRSGKGTPVLIINDSLQNNPVKFIDTVQISLRRQEYFNSLKMIDTVFVRFMTEWQDAWESKDIDRYSNCYFQTRFNAQGLNWDGWKEKKIKTFQLYDTINVTCSKLAVSDTTDSTAVLRFSQVYQTEKVRFQNYKQLNLEKEQGMWKITREAAF